MCEEWRTPADTFATKMKHAVKIWVIFQTLQRSRADMSKTPSLDLLMLFHVNNSAV